MKPTVFVLFLAASALAQTAPPAFEVANVKINPQLGEDDSVEISPGTLRMRNVSFTTMVKWAYQVQEPQVSGPGWMDSQRYDVLAKAGSPAKEAEMRGMLQMLLAERFKLTAHRESKQMSVFELVEAKGGHKMRASEGDGPAQRRKDPVRGAIMEGISLPELAAQFAQDLRTPILDMTGLKGRYDFEFNVRAYLPTQGEGRVDPLDIMQTALQKELGLKLDSRRAPVEILVIDHLDKSPTGN